MSLDITFAYPGDLALKTGGYGYDRKLIEGLEALGWKVELLSLGDGFPSPSPEVLKEAERSLSALPDDALLLIDGLAFGVLDAWASREASRLRLAILVHHPLALETGLSQEERLIFTERERRALSHAAQIFVTSAMTARELVAGYDVDPQRLTIALPGTDRLGLAPRRGDPPMILSVGTLTRRKGHDVLVRALKQIESLPWQACIVGAGTLDPRTADALENLILSEGLSNRIKLAGEVEDTRLEMLNADIFALASRYEGYGMVFAEALSHGLPIVGCATGAVPDVVPEEAGILVPVDDVDAFTDALRRLLADPHLRDEKAQGSALAGEQLPTWAHTAAIFSSRLQDLT
ncbi:glycosyltransferase family 4 protein [Rhizobium glycinendophyticum]|uniref:Glycosyltransferase family 4 protein n=1 Tax=Rhizobium glycinendophyticum TaxID=2589807 RepID=A0A504UCM0_9HYPH|nr:glycosyltransferase family 4 protein [Rhizobium glycinendophyticum]TPP04631.1 glycosyltransferase family 4 protein [Rhizobium glycinendophyticum]